MLSAYSLPPFTGAVLRQGSGHASDRRGALRVLTTCSAFSRPGARNIGNEREQLEWNAIRVPKAGAAPREPSSAFAFFAY